MSSQIEHSFNKEDKKKARRTKRDQIGRTFTCKCGKSYLSYPALYTHTKTKHQGRTPKQKIDEIPPQDQTQKKQKKQPIYEIIEIITRYFPDNNLTSYPTPLNTEQNQYIQKIIILWKQNKQAKIQDPSNNLSQNINTILGRFLYQIANQVTKEGLIYLKQLICKLKTAICQEYKDLQYCDTANSLSLINFFNQFVLSWRNIQHIPRGSPIYNTILTCKVLESLGAWIFQQRYTNYLVKINLSLA